MMELRKSRIVVFPSPKSSGGGDVDLSHYVTKDELASTLEGYVTQETLQTELDNVTPKRLLMDDQAQFNSRFRGDSQVRFVDFLGITFLVGQMDYIVTTLTSHGGTVFTLPDNIHRPLVDHRVQMTVKGRYRNDQGTETASITSFNATINTQGVVTVDDWVTRPEHDSEFGLPQAFINTSYLNGA